MMKEKQYNLELTLFELLAVGDAVDMRRYQYEAEAEELSTVMEKLAALDDRPAVLAQRQGEAVLGTVENMAD